MRLGERLCLPHMTNGSKVISCTDEQIAGQPSGAIDPI